MPSTTDRIASIREQIKENAAFLYPNKDQSLLLLYRGQAEGYQAILNCERTYGNDITASSACERSPRRAWKGLLRALSEQVYIKLSREEWLTGGNAGMMLEESQTEHAMGTEDWFWND